MKTRKLTAAVVKPDLTTLEVLEDKLKTFNSLCAINTGLFAYTTLNARRAALLNEIEQHRPLTHWERLCRGDRYEDMHPTGQPVLVPCTCFPKAVAV